MRLFTWTAVLILAAQFCACDFEPRVAAEMVSMNQSQPIGKEKSLSADIRFDIGSLEIAGEKDTTLYSVDLEYDKSSYQPEVHYQPPVGGDEGSFSFRLESNHKIGLRTEHHNRLRLNLTKSIPLKLNINTGVGDARLSLSGLEIARLDLESGVGASKLSSYEPNSVPCEFIRIKNGVGSMDAVGLGNLNFRELEFEGGVGGANLDFTGSWKRDADIRVQVGVGGVNLRMPREIGVRVEAEKHFLSGLHLDGFNKRDSYYYSESYDRAKIRVSVRVATGVGGFRITWV
jgi:hypothetical protein